MANSTGLSSARIISIDLEDDSEDSDLEMMISSPNFPKKSYGAWQDETSTNDEDDIILVDAALPSAVQCSSQGKSICVTTNSPLDLSVGSSTSKSSASDFSLSGTSSEESDGSSSDSECSADDRKPQSLLSKRSWDNILGSAETDALGTYKWGSLLDRDPDHVDPPRIDESPGNSEMFNSEMDKQECVVDTSQGSSVISKPAESIHVETKLQDKEVSHITAPCDNVVGAQVMCPIVHAGLESGADIDTCPPASPPECRAAAPSIDDDAITDSDITGVEKLDSDVDDSEDVDSEDSGDDVEDVVDDHDENDKDDVSDSSDTETPNPAIFTTSHKSGLTEDDWGSGTCVFDSETRKDSKGRKNSLKTIDSLASTSHDCAHRKPSSTNTTDFSINSILDKFMSENSSCSGCEEKTGFFARGNLAANTMQSQPETSKTDSQENSSTPSSVSQENFSSSSADLKDRNDFYRGDLILKIKTKRRYSVSKHKKHKKRKDEAKTEVAGLLPSCQKEENATGGSSETEASDGDSSDNCVILDSDSEDGDTDDIIFIKRTRKRTAEPKAVDLSVDTENDQTSAVTVVNSPNSCAMVSSSTSAGDKSTNAPAPVTLPYSTNNMDWITSLHLNPPPSSYIDIVPFSGTSSTSSQQDAVNFSTPSSLSASGDASSSNSTAVAVATVPSSAPPPFTRCTSTGDITTNISGLSVNSSTNKKPAVRRTVSAGVDQPSTSSSSSNSTSNRSTTIPFKKRRFGTSSSSASLSHKPATATGDAQGTSKPHTNNYTCYNCGDALGYNSGSTCLEGHRCCDGCLQTRVKHILTKSRKGSLRCGVSDCNSYYTLSELRHSLPPMVVDILEDKLDTEYMNFATQFALGSGGADREVVISDSEAELFDDDSPQEEVVPPPPKEKSVADLPDHWIPMLEDQDYQTVRLDPESTEYQDLYGMFHRTMLTPRANIVTIKRVQNPILWLFYQVKRTQMSKEHCGPVKEMQLFHGTKKSVADAICRSNFDWRLSGTNGTMYGQGSYFALDASYSHKFTDPPPRCAHRGGGLLNSVVSSLIAFSPPFSLSIPGPLSHFPTPPTPMGLPSTSGISNWNNIPASFQPTDLSTSANAATNEATPPSTPVEHVYNVAIPGWQSEADVNPSLGHTHIMFVAKVLVGLYAQGRHCMRKPPALNPRNPYGRCYDSCINDMCDPKIFVIFDSAQCFPEYIIEFQNKPPNFLS